MKKPFKYEIKAASAYRAFQMASDKIPKEKQGYAELDASADDVLKAVEGKKLRALDNPKLYADKIAEYEAMLAAYKTDLTRDSSPVGRERAIVGLILAHGDIKVDNVAKCAVRQISPGLYCVFGYDFSG